MGPEREAVNALNLAFFRPACLSPENSAKLK